MTHPAPRLLPGTLRLESCLKYLAVLHVLQQCVLPRKQCGMLLFESPCPNPGLGYRRSDQVSWIPANDDHTRHEFQTEELCTFQEGTVDDNAASGKTELLVHLFVSGFLAQGWQTDQSWP